MTPEQPGARRKRRHKLSWSRRRKVMLLDLLGREEPLERVAAAVALGIGIGFSPFVGFHLFIALGLAALLRLKPLDAALGTLAGNPWSFPPVWALGYRLGRALLHHDVRRVPPLNWAVLLHSGMGWILHPLETARQIFGPRAFVPRLHAFLLGTTTLAVLIGALAYFLALAALQIYHRRHPRVAARAARRRSKDTGETATLAEPPLRARSAAKRPDDDSSHLVN